MQPHRVSVPGGRALVWLDPIAAGDLPWHSPKAWDALARQLMDSLACEISRDEPSPVEPQAGPTGPMPLQLCHPLPQRDLLPQRGQRRTRPATVEVNLRKLQADLLHASQLLAASR